MKKLLLLLLGLPFTSVQALDIQNLEIGQTDIKKINQQIIDFEEARKTISSSIIQGKLQVLEI